MNNWKKRLFDVILSAFGLILALPIFLVISLAIIIDSSGPVLFVQERVGQFGKPFKILKFRTMKDQQTGSFLTRARDARVTKVGRFLRKTKLDELPQLINVLKGDMSFVGPRPEVPYFVKHYTLEQREILHAKPGITDLASIEYRNESELFSGHEDTEVLYLNTIMPKKIELNKRYLENMTLSADIKIIIKTISTLLGGS